MGLGGDKNKVDEKNEKKEEIDAILEKCVLYQCGKEQEKETEGMNRKGKYIKVESKKDEGREVGQANIYITNYPYHKGINIYILNSHGRTKTMIWC